MTAKPPNNGQIVTAASTSFGFAILIAALPQFRKNLE
jgi:hypothetical protein